MSTPITAQMVNDLRKRTDRPMMECESVLQEAAGDMEKAVELLRIRNKGVGDKRSMNETTEGRIGVYIDPKAAVAAIVEMRTESAPAAKSDHFIALAKDMAKQVADNNPASVEVFIASELAAGQTWTGTH